MEPATSIISILRTSPMPVITLDPEGTVRSANLAAEDTFGWLEKDLLGHRLPAVGEDDWRDFLRLLVEAAGGRPVGARELAFRRKDGWTIDVSLSLTPIHDGTGRASSIMLTLTDVTDRKRTEEALRESRERYRILVETSPDSIAMVDRDGRIMMANQRTADLYGYEHALELVGVPVFDLIAPEERERARSAHARRLEGKLGNSSSLEYMAMRKDGSPIPIEVSVSVVEGRDALPHAMIAVSRDISQRKQSERALQEAYRFNQAVIENAHEGIVVYDRALRYVLWNAFMEELTGMAAEEVIGRPALEMFPHMREQRIDLLLERALAGETVRASDVPFHVPRTGKSGWIAPSYAPHHGAGGEIIGVIGTISDVTARKEAEAALRQSALYDALTSLPNRTLLQDRLRQAIPAARRDRTGLALLLMDLDRFKEINDTFGHHHGDALLRQVGPRLQGALRGSDTVARLGGDEFAVLLPDTDVIGATLAAEKLSKALAPPFKLNGHFLMLDSSIGIAVFPEHGSDVDALLRRADVAMYIAKGSGSGYAVYESERDRYTPDRLALVNELRAAIEGNELALYFQPKVHLGTGMTDSVEALARWNHPERGFIPPDVFIPLAEHAGLIKPLNRWVLQAALHQSRDWYDRGLSIRVAINVSASALHDPYFLETVAAGLKSCDVPASALEIEITESALMVDTTRAKEVLTALHEMGVRISIDDFGTGYSSLAYLRRLPADGIKIDKSFVIDMSKSREDATIVRSVVDLGHNLELQVVAEGVEDQISLDMLTRLGCDQAQGYYLGRPMPQEDCTRWLQRATVSQRD